MSDFTLPMHPDLSEMVADYRRPPTIRLADPNGAAIQINRPGTDELLIRILGDGTLEYGKEYDPDEAARVFWEAMTRLLPNPWRRGPFDVDDNLTGPIESGMQVADQVPDRL